MPTQIFGFSSTGKRTPVSSGRPLANLGREVNGKVYQHPRIKQEPLAGGSVEITNPAASGTRGRNARTAGLGMGAANTQMQRGRNRDF